MCQSNSCQTFVPAQAAIRAPDPIQNSSGIAINRSLRRTFCRSKKSTLSCFELDLRR